MRGTSFDRIEPHVKQTPLSADGLMPVRRPTARRPRLDRLSATGIGEFRTLFAEASPVTAADFARLDGDVAMRSFPAVGQRVLGALMARPTYFWVGKSFRHTTESVALGHNVFTALGGVRAMNFVATVGRSVVDGRPAVCLDYTTRPGVPESARGIYDELREIEPGLWLGPSYFRTRGRRLPMGWFALDASVPFDAVI
ncbi:hypothetical protein ACFO5K_11120 [Nocardia halotolerans]|uniref:Uncharacterized protein n=1 Tax=Nocardia halotolerans TaxID=1755878 RepID=A0ABV8VH29_9NOCA